MIADVTITSTGLLVHNFCQISFQRFPCPSDGVLEHAMRSWGALPVGSLGDARFAIPLEQHEAVWLGVHLVDDVESPDAACLNITAIRSESTAVDLLSGERDDADRHRERGGFYIPTVTGIDGIRRADGRMDAIAGPGAPRVGVDRLEFGLTASRRHERRRRPESSGRLAAFDAPASGPLPANAACHPDDRAMWDVDRRVAFVVALLTGAEFTAATGLRPPEPMSDRDPYRGWRFP